MSTVASRIADEYARIAPDLPSGVVSAAERERAIKTLSQIFFELAGEKAS